MQKFIYPTPEERIQILKEHGEPYDRRIREHECANRTGLSRSRRWVLEQEGAFPARAHLGKVSVSGCSLMCSGGLCIRQSKGSKQPIQKRQ